MLKKVLVFFLRLTLVYGFLIMPWPGFNQAYSTCFCTFAQLVSLWQNDQTIVTFDTDMDHPSDTQMVIVNRSLMHNDGSGPVRNVNLDTAGFRRSTALLMALVIATPLSRPRRIQAFIWELTGEGLFILLFLSFVIWNESSEIDLVTFSPFSKSIANSLMDTITSQMGLSVPIFIWLLSSAFVGRGQWPDLDVLAQKKDRFVGRSEIRQ